MCLKWYKWSGEDGAPPYDPAILIRMLFLCYLYNISERQIEERVNLDLSFKYFAGLGADGKAPDHSTLTKFKNRLILGGGKSAYDELLNEILRQALRKGIVFGSIQVTDATHTIANVNTAKDHGRQSETDRHGKPKNPEDIKPARDSDAKWGNKGDKTINDPKTGEKKIVPQWFYGYKSHTNINALSGMITSIETTGGEVPDGNIFVALVEKDDQTKILPEIRTGSADRGYDYGDNHEYLKSRGFGDAIRLNDYRTAASNEFNSIWLELKKSKEYQAGKVERYKIERNFGTEKQGHGLGRCRYLGLVKYHAQSTLTALAINLKVVVAAMTGSTLKGYAYAGNGVRLPSS
jgi:IS5 family transposase